MGSADRHRGRFDRRQLLRGSVAGSLAASLDIQFDFEKISNVACLFPGYTPPHQVFERANKILQREFHASDDVRVLGQVERVLSQAFYHHFWIGTAERLAQAFLNLLDQAEERLGFSRNEWQRQQGTIIRDLVGQFFWKREVDPEWPAFLVLLPGNVSTRHRFESQSFPTTTRVKYPCDEHKISDCRKYPIYFGAGWDTLRLEIDLRRVNFRCPPDRPGRKAVVVERHCERGITSNMPLRLEPPASIQQVSLASRDDIPDLNRGSYYPGSNGLRVTDEQGKTVYTDVNVLILARLVPGTSVYDARVHQLSITMAKDGQIMDFNALDREWGQFLLQYAGIAEEVARGVAEH